MTGFTIEGQGGCGRKAQLLLLGLGAQQLGKGGVPPSLASCTHVVSARWPCGTLMVSVRWPCGTHMVSVR